LYDKPWAVHVNGQFILTGTPRGPLSTNIAGINKEKATISNLRETRVSFSACQGSTTLECSSSVLNGVQAGQTMTDNYPLHKYFLAEHPKIMIKKIPLSKGKDFSFRVQK
jgi:hypothetical protein